MAMDLQKIKDLLQTKPKNNGGDINFISIPKAANTPLRVWVIPYKGLPGKLIFKHYNLPLLDNETAENNRTPNETCMKTFNMPCPICKMLEKFEGRLDMKDFSANNRSAHNVLDDKGVVSVLTSSHTLFWTICDWAINPNIGDVTDPNDCHGLTISRETENGKLKIAYDLKGIKIDTAYMEKCHDLDKIWKVDDADVTRLSQRALKLEQLLNERLTNIASPVPSPTMPPSTPPASNLNHTGNIQTTPSTLLPSTPPTMPPSSGVINNPTTPSLLKRDPKTAVCFGNSSLFDENADDCMLCPKAFDCENIIKSGKK